MVEVRDGIFVYWGEKKSGSRTSLTDIFCVDPWLFVLSIVDKCCGCD
jgi:hypothetical protein